MSGLSARNLNLNLNLNLGAGAPGGAFGAARFNTHDFRKLVVPGEPVAPARPAGGYARHAANWDADMRAYTHVRGFVELYPNWFAELKTVADSAGRPVHAMSQSYLEDQVNAVLDAAPEREDRFAEILDQHSGEGSIKYWLGMLRIEAGSQPAALGMILAARRIGEMAVMCLKEHYGGLRPSQVCPNVLPMMDPPMTPAYPAGHALGSYLISYCLMHCFSRLPQSHPDAGNPLAATGALIDLAERVAENRVIAGLHFPTDNDAGKQVAARLFAMLTAVPGFWIASGNRPSLRDQVREEFPQYA